MKLQIRESFEKLDINLFITDYVGDVVNLLVNKPKPYRIVYNKFDDIYIIAPADELIHEEMTQRALYAGYLPNTKEFIYNHNIDIDEFDSYKSDNLIFLTDSDLTNFGSYTDIYNTTEFGYEYPIITGSLFIKSKYTKNYFKQELPDLYNKLSKFAIEESRVLYDNAWNL